MTEWGISTAVTVPRRPLVVPLRPILRHHLVHSRLMGLLLAACPDGLEVLSAPADVVLADDTVLQPDLLVLLAADLSRHRLASPPLLAVDVTSLRAPPLDLRVRRARYQEAGVPSYWVVDPEALRLRAWALRGRSYDEVADVAAGQEWRSDLPFPVTVRPADLGE
ncbi:Uma2 family endonuclease [Nocardioides stalactiti]|uniref:Uma2 family endonuclease n=1 Tax=Nocardioides stalactiti TaxID=2755356 RepID=UPI0016037614|nr:Uma2 family endonuclease [Nocardioides stalactiti]